MKYSGTTNNRLSDLFVNGLLAWNEKENRRQMPWKGEKDPYKIWLSEIILQQTRVEQGLSYYQKFIASFPHVAALAAAPEEQVMKHWEGLGYYSRCRNLITTAKYIANELNGVFPKDYEAILGLKGIGSYTAAAIGSFAYNLPYAVLDGNVFRVLSRVFCIDTPIDTTGGKKQFSVLAQAVLPKDRAGIYNQAIMDFGATVCKPVPACGHCFFNPHCTAFLLGQQDLLPVKEKKVKVRHRWFNYIVLQYEAQIAVQKRMVKDIWQDLFQPLLIETDGAVDTGYVLAELSAQYDMGTYALLDAVRKEQKLTHQVIHFSFIHLQLATRPRLPQMAWVPLGDLKKYAFPKTVQTYLTTDLPQQKISWQ